MLTTEQIQRITAEAAIGKPSTVKGKEAAELRKQIDAEIVEIKNAGQVVEIPKEWEADV